MMKSIVAGIVGTVVMTAVMMLAGMMGMPVMSPPHMLAGAMGLPVAVGFAMHFAIGIIFAIGYTYLFKVNISNIWLKGVVFGVVAFIAAQIGMGVMGIIFPIPDPEGPMALVATAGFLGHIIFGVVVAKVVGNTVYASDAIM